MSLRLRRHVEVSRTTTWIARWSTALLTAAATLTLVGCQTSLDATFTCESDDQCAEGQVCQADDHLQKRCISSEAAEKEIRERRDQSTDISCDADDDCAEGFVCQADDERNRRCIGEDAAREEVDQRTQETTDVECDSDEDCIAGRVCRRLARDLPKRCVGRDVFIDVAAGHRHTCAIRASGQIVCWGGVEDTITTGAPDADDFRAVTSVVLSDEQGTNDKDSFNCALDAGGEVTCWGALSTPAAAPPSGTDFELVDAGRSQSCGIESDGRLVCWGSLGAEKPPGSRGRSYRDVSSGRSSTCAIAASDGEIHCWGDLGESPLPDGDYERIAVEFNRACAIDDGESIRCERDHLDGGGIPIPDSGPFRDLAFAGGYLCGLASTGRIACTGSLHPNAPGPPGGSTFSQVTVGGHHACALRNDGDILCWGNNPFGQCKTHDVADGDVTCRTDY